VRIQRDAKLDLRGGDHLLDFEYSSTILGSLTAKGVNQLRGNEFSVGGNLTVDVKRESQGVILAGNGMTVGKSLTVLSGRGGDEIRLNGGAVGRNATFRLGDGTDRNTLLHPWLTTVGGNLAASLGSGAEGEFWLNGTVKGSVKVTSRAAQSRIYFHGSVQGTSIKYTGGPGQDYVEMKCAAPDATATLEIDSGDDTLVLDGTSNLALRRVDVDFGNGNDTLIDAGFMLPPGSDVRNLP
jgi:hypothetical protein